MARAHLLLALAAIPVLLGGCGSDPVTVDSRTLRFKLDEYRLMPQDVRVTAGRLRIVATNVGRLTHNVRVVQRNAEDREALPREISGTRSAQPGESTSVTIENLPPGEYRILCSIANHDDLGQYGTLIAVAPDGS